MDPRSTRVDRPLRTVAPDDMTLDLANPPGALEMAARPATLDTAARPGAPGMTARAPIA